MPDNGSILFNEPLPVTIVGGSAGSGGSTSTSDASAAKQDAQTALLTAIDADTSRIPALGQGTKAASVPVTIASDQGNLPTNSAQVNGVALATGLGAASTGTPRVAVSSDSSALMGVAATSPALTAFRNPALVNTPVAVKTSAGRAHAYHFNNSTSAVAYVHFFNTAVASVTVGTTVPVWTMAVPAGATIDGYWPSSLAFSAAITIAATTTVTGATAPTTGVLVNLGYI